jgi:hypothetical protein
VRDDLSGREMIVGRSQNFSGAKCLKRTKSAGAHNVWVVLGHGLRGAGQFDTLNDVWKRAGFDFNDSLEGWDCFDSPFISLRVFEFDMGLYFELFISSLAVGYLADLLHFL